MLKKGVSIILCCYNSELRLPKTLEYLAKQELRKEIPVELLIVNNASTDRTKEIALEECKKFHDGFSYRMIDEEMPGQMYARERGVQESLYEYILFCDDDNWLQPDYMQKAFDLMESTPRIGALSGQCIAVSDIDFPEWFPDFEEIYAVGTQAEDSGDISKKGWIWGAGMMSRRSLLIKVFDKKNSFLNQGRTGNVLTSGDDCEICKRILLSGYKLYYDKSLLIYHYINPEKLTWKYRKKLSEGINLADFILRKYDFMIQEMNKSFMKKTGGILYDICKLFKPGASNDKLKSEIRAKTGLLFKSAKFVKDFEYKSIIRYLLECN